MRSFIRSNRLNFVKIRTFHKHLRSLCGAERKLVKEKLQKRISPKIMSKIYFVSKLDMRILQRLALNPNLLLLVSLLLIKWSKTLSTAMSCNMPVCDHFILSYKHCFHALTACIFYWQLLRPKS